MNNSEQNEGMINWALDKADSILVTKITNRALKLIPKADYMNVYMDVSATHLNGCKLSLSGLLAADDGNFLHDIFGIIRHINRENGKLMDCFVPRYSAKYD